MNYQRHDIMRPRAAELIHGGRQVEWIVLGNEGYAHLATRSLRRLVRDHVTLRIEP